METMVLVLTGMDCLTFALDGCANGVGVSGSSAAVAEEEAPWPLPGAHPLPNGLPCAFEWMSPYPAESMERGHARVGAHQRNGTRRGPHQR